MARKKDAEKAEQVTPNSLRNKAERMVLEAHRDEYYSNAEKLFTDAGLTFTRRSTPEEREQKKAVAEQEKAERKLAELLQKHPSLAQKLNNEAPTHATGSVELTGDLTSTGAVGA